MYTPLKVTTDYSLLSSLIKVKDLINFCVTKNIKSCAICDTNLFGSIEFYKLAKKNNIKPIIGLEIKVNSNQVYLYAKNYDGYKNLLKINTIINERELTVLELERYCNNILLIVPFKSINIYNDLYFFQDKYIGYENKNELQSSLVKSSNVVYVNNIKSFNFDELKYLKYLDIINGNEPKDYIENYYVTNIDEYDIKRINEVVNKLNIEIPFNNRYIPKYSDSINSFEFLKNLCIKGLNKRLNGEVTEEYTNRLKYELSVIKKMGFIDYFLIVYDYVLYAKKNKILVGPGRGSAAGSLVSYVIGITDIDPLKYNLLFERFLNYERITMPDIDIDFDNTKRDEVINYVKNKYGINCVAGGMTYTTLKTKLVLREVGKLLKLDERLLDKFLKVINRDKSLKENLLQKDVKEYLTRYNELKNVYEISLRLEGLKKNISTHAAGIVISSIELDEIIPMYKNNDVYLTGIGMEHLEDLGLLKMDFLALKNLSIINNIIANIDNFNINKIPLDDKLVFDLFSRADTEGIFQFETNVFKNMLTKYKPRNFNELVASIALVRPGPSQELETYIKRKNGQEKITYYHDDLKPILEETYGVIVYQEQVINILVKLANFSYAEADNIRRAMSKKKMDIILNVKEDFIKRSILNGYDKGLVENIFEHILKFASYGFNKAHSVSYAFISYQMAYLKVHYKSLFTFELLNNSLGNSTLIKKHLNDLKKDKYIINTVDINKSKNTFIVENNNIYLPFKLIKGLKSDLIKNILEERKENGSYENVYEFFRRTIKFITKNEYIMLINASVLKCFNINTKTLITNVDALINYGNLYNDLGEYALAPELSFEKEYEVDLLRQNELNSYGFFISNHPASKYDETEVMKLTNLSNHVFKNVICYVMVDSIKNIKTKKNEDMAFITASDETGKADFTIFPKNYHLLKNIKNNSMIKVWGSVTKRFDKYSIIVNNILEE